MDTKAYVIEAEGVNEGIKTLILKYFKFNVLEKGQRVQKDMLVNIIQTFTYCWNRHKTLSEIEEELIYTDIWELRQRRVNLADSNYNPFPIRLGELKPKLQREASESGKNLHAYILFLLLEKEKKEYHYLKLHCVPRLNREFRYKRSHHYPNNNTHYLFETNVLESLIKVKV